MVDAVPGWYWISLHFNSNNRKQIKSLLVDISVFEYLAILVENCLSERTPCYRTDEGLKEYIVTAGLCMGSPARECHE